MQRLREAGGGRGAAGPRVRRAPGAHPLGRAGIVSDVGTFLSLKAGRAAQKEKLHAEWTEDLRADPGADRRGGAPRYRRGPRRAVARRPDQYLETSKRKEFGLFRDIIIESEYDPLVNHARSVRAPT